MENVAFQTQKERLEEFRSREAQVKAALDRNSDRYLPNLNGQMKAAIAAKTRTQRISWVRKGAATIGLIAGDVAACTRGCSACCHIPVMLLASEAQHIAREIGRSLLNVPDEKRNAEPPSWRGEGHACPFLVAGECSIYEHRPIACRTHFNLDRDAYLCEHQESVEQVPNLDVSDFSVASVSILMGADDYVAELRDFFGTRTGML